MKAEELKGKSQDELKKMLLELRKSQLNLRFQKSNGQLSNTSEVRKIRRDIARIKTFLNADATTEAPAKKTTTKKQDKKAA